MFISIEELLLNGMIDVTHGHVTAHSTYLCSWIGFVHSKDWSSNFNFDESLYGVISNICARNKMSMGDIVHRRNNKLKQSIKIGWFRVAMLSPYRGIKRLEPLHPRTLSVKFSPVVLDRKIFVYQCIFLFPSYLPFKKTVFFSTRGPQALTVTWVSETALTSCQKGSYSHINSLITE